MLLTSKISLVMVAAAGFAGPFAISTNLPAGKGDAARLEQPALVELQPGLVRYRVAGDFTRGGKPAEAPLVMARIARPIGIMKTQVTAAEYQQCVAAKACKPLASPSLARDRPAVQASWHDAYDYASWLSRRTGMTYRLPTDEEWTYAAGSRWRDDAVAVDPSDPSRRWLDRYEREAKLKEEASAEKGEPQPVGRFGANENGLLDLSGNVWEWTSTCFTRVALDDVASQTVNCGVRVVEGQHRSYVTDFIRDARAGGCAAGVPPINLGFRLVVDRDKSVSAFFSRLLQSMRLV